MPAEKNETSKAAFLELSLLPALVFPVLFFGGVPLWSQLLSCALIFMAFFFSPSAIDECFKVPRDFFVGNALVLFWIIFQLFYFSRNPYAGRMEILLFTATAALFLMVLRMNLKNAELLTAALAFLGIAEVLYALFQLHFGGEKILWITKKFYLGFATGTFINRNHLAGFLELCMGLQLGLLLNSFFKKDRTQIFFWFLGFLLCAYGLLKTGSRMGMLSFAAALVIYGLPLFFKRPKTAVVFMLPLLALVGGLVYLKWDFIYGRFYDTSLGVWSLQGRLTLWQHIRPMLEDYGWTGTGLGAFKWVFPRYQPVGMLTGWGHAHNDYLELATGFGLPAFGIFMAVYIRFLLTLIPKMAACNYKTPFALSWGILTGVTAFIIHGFADFNFAIPGNRLVFFACLALAWRFLKNYRHEYENEHFF